MTFIKEDNMAQHRIKSYTFMFEQDNEIVTTAVFLGHSRLAARKLASLYKRKGLKNDYPNVSLKKVKIIW